MRDQLLIKLGATRYEAGPCKQLGQGRDPEGGGQEPYDGHVLSAQLEQTTNLLQDIGRAPKQVIVDLGYRGVGADNPGVQTIHWGNYKSLSGHEKRLLKRRQAIEPLIWHTKADHSMDRCWLQGAVGDALHALSCAAGYNIRWLPRAIARLGLGGFFTPASTWSCMRWVA